MPLILRIFLLFFTIGDGTWILYKFTVVPLGQNFIFCPNS